MAQIRELKKQDDLNALLRDSSHKPVLLLKHSTRCPISAQAYDEYLRHANQDEGGEIVYALVLVVEHRPVSNAVEEALGIKHESPQAILVKDGRAVWHASHWSIKADALKEQILRLG